jgi:hypothetical protein
MADTACASCFAKVFARAVTDSSIVLAERNRYTIEEWDVANGRLLKRVTVNPSWFVGTAPRGSALGLAPQASRISRIARDTGSLLWIAATTATSNWKPYSGKPQVIRNGLIILSGPREDTAFTNYQLRNLDMVIEVVDLARNRVLVTERTNAKFLGLLDDGFAYDWVEDADGYSRFRVWRFAVRVKNDE